MGGELCAARKRIEAGVLFALLPANLVYWPLAVAGGALGNGATAFAHSAALWCPAVATAVVLVGSLRRLGRSVSFCLAAVPLLSGAYWTVGLFGPFVVCVVVSGSCS